MDQLREGAALATESNDEGVVLVFPLAGDDALKAMRILRYSGLRVAGAGSVRPDLDDVDWYQLPDVYGPAFPEALRRLISDLDVRRIVTFSHVAYQVLSELVAAHECLVAIPRSSPSALLAEDVAWSKKKAEGLYEACCSVAPGQETFSRTFLSALAFHGRHIHGQSSLEKMGTLAGALADGPQGDIVEIGAFYGRSAWALWALSVVSDTGPLLVVDPWHPVSAMQGEANRFVDQGSEDIDWNVAFSGFLLALGLGPGRSINYLRATAREAFDTYSNSRRLESQEFGSTIYSGSIALLHIDGNHDFDEVRNELHTWGSRVVSGGWIVLDDYLWLHADGPRRAGDEYLQQMGAQIARAFVNQSSLYVKLA